MVDRREFIQLSAASKPGAGHRRGTRRRLAFDQSRTSRPGPEARIRPVATRGDLTALMLVHDS